MYNFNKIIGFIDSWLSIFSISNYREQVLLSIVVKIYSKSFKCRAFSTAITRELTPSLR